MSEKWMWNGAPRGRTRFAAARTSWNALTVVNAPSLVACMCAKSITGRIQVDSREEIAITSSRLPKSLTRPMISTPNGTPRSFASIRLRKSVSWETTEAIVCLRVRPRRKPGWKTTGPAPAAFAIPAEWSSIPVAIPCLRSRSTWPMKPAIGACTESAIFRLRASFPNSSAHG